MCVTKATMSSGRVTLLVVVEPYDAYKRHVANTVLQTKVFRDWLDGLTDETAKGAVTARINRIKSACWGISRRSAAR